MKALKEERARHAAWRAVQRGELVRPSRCELCNCESAHIDGHHDDYDKPLEVRWLCRSCHQRIHFRPLVEPELSERMQRISLTVRKVVLP